MKFLFDFFPILLFFFAYKFYGIFIATAVAIGATVAQVTWGWFRHRKVQRMQLITLAIIVVFGGATLLLKDEIFIKWKPSVINWLFGLVFLGSQFIGEQPMVQRMMGTNLSLPKLIWSRLNLMWAVFFILLGSANLFVMYNFDTNAWVNFKLFGMFGLMLLFVFAQAIYLSRYVTEESESKIEE